MIANGRAVLGLTPKTIFDFFENQFSKKICTVSENSLEGEVFKIFQVDLDELYGGIQDHFDRVTSSAMAPVAHEQLQAQSVAQVSKRNRTCTAAAVLKVSKACRGASLDPQRKVDGS